MICKRCIYDDHIPYISFDQEGICNYCHQHDQLEQEYPTGEKGWHILEALAAKIKQDGKNKPYDVVVGISGGCDSSYLLHLSRNLGLRPLAAHFDNTWNSTIAVENIHNILKIMNLDLFTHIVDNHEFCDIFKSFLNASVPDIDTPSDIGLATTHYLAAAKYGIKYVFEGHSFRTEGISPHGWFYMDAKYIETVQKQFGDYALNTFPNLWMSQWLKWTIVNGIKKIRPLYYLDYDKEKTKEILQKEFDWQWYGGHHMENRTAYFTNNYYLPKKFNIDLRYSEFSALVRSGKMDREEALTQIREPKAFNNDILEEIKKRLNLSGDEFEAIMALPRKTYRDYHTYKKTFEKMRGLFWGMYRLDLVPKSFYMKYTKQYQDDEKKPRIFIGLRELSGYYHHLKRGFDHLGIESVFVNLSGHPYHYGTDKNPKIIRIINKVSQTIGVRFFSNFAMRLLWLGFFQNILGIFLFFWALNRFDVFIFASNSTFFYFLDLPILRLLKKKIIFVFHGSESRPVYLNGYVLGDTKTKTILTGIILARVQKIIISVIDRYADYSINIPPQAHFHTRPFVSWLCIGVPHDIASSEKSSDNTLNKNLGEKTVRILHAPSKPGPKGTDVIRRVIQSLKNKGLIIDFVEITGKPNAEVLKELQQCDFVIDEIYSDTPMAVFATEAAFAGKPAVVGSYYAEDITKDLAPESVPPSAFCHPDRIEETVENMIRDAEWRTSLGKRAQKFVYTHWTATKVAEHYLMLIAGDFPKEWLYYSKNIHYLHGCGLPEEKARAIIKRFVEIGGKSSLCLSDKPDLEEQLIKFALCQEKP